jgi:hypothetical protein
MSRNVVIVKENRSPLRDPEAVNVVYSLFVAVFFFIEEAQTVVECVEVQRCVFGTTDYCKHRMISMRRSQKC